MKIFYPSYYKDFKCIADKCKHSCCVGWEIAVDEATLEKYKSLYVDDILPHIRNGEITLCSDGGCPFLEESGLCYIISNYGEDAISEICQRHPRFYHKIGDRIECGIGASCEEACRVILSSDGYADFCQGEWCGEASAETDFDTLSHREDIYSILSDSSISYHEKRFKIINKYHLFDPCDGHSEWNKLLLGMEYLDEGDRGLLRVGKTDKNPENHKYLERFLAYLVFRHLSVADNNYNLRARLGFCLLLTAILENHSAETCGSFEEICDFARIISQEIEYSEDNTAELIFELECFID